MTVIIPPAPRARPIIIDSTPTVWGEISGSLSAQTDLQAALTAKQAALVSGTTLKTLNGTTLLGSGDIVISGGSGSATNLSYTAATRVLASDTGTDATLPLATGTDAGLMASADFTKLAGVATGATANATDAALRARADHTGVQLAATISDFATAVAATASVAANTAKVSNATHTGDVTGATALTIAAGAVTLAKQADVATATVFYRKTAATGAPEVQTLATLKTDLGLTGTNGGDQTITLTGDVTGTGVGSFATTIAADAVTNAKLANVATATIKGRVTAATGDPEDLTGTQATTLLNPFTSALKGLVPSSGGGTTNFLRADGTFAAPGGGGSPGGASGEIQFNAAGAFGGAADVEIEGGQLRLPAISTPTVPAASGLKLFGRNLAGRMLPAIIGPSGIDTSLQPLLASNRISMFLPNGNATTTTAWGAVYGSTGTATIATVATTNRFTRMKGIEYLITAAAVTAAAGWRGTADQWTVGGTNADDGGFFMVTRWGPATGVATTTTRALAGMQVGNTATDVEPSGLLNMCGMGWDAADTNIQFMHNDGSGTATKTDLGASFPVPTVDRTSCYEVALFSPPGSTQSLSYRISDLVSGAQATGTVTTDLPALTTLIAPVVRMSVGGTSSVVGVRIFGHYIETDY